MSNGAATGDVKVSLKLSDLKPLHAQWIIETCNHLKHQNHSIIKAFDAAEMSEAITCASDVFARVGNPFDEQRKISSLLTSEILTDKEHSANANEGNVNLFNISNC